MAVTFNILTDAPTLIYPNGGEVFTNGNINIQWVEPLNVPSGDTIWYEIFITDNFEDSSKPELIQIAQIPYGNSVYSYYVNNNIKGNKCRIGIRAVNQGGVRGKISFSANNFMITNESLPSPAFLEPYSGGIYFSYIPFIFDNKAVITRCSQRAFYNVYYKSDMRGIDWTLIRSNIMVGSDPFDLDMSNVPTSSDYILKIEMVDSEHVSPPVFVNNITINNINYFTIDTVPPVGSIQIIDNKEYVKNRDFLVRLESYDESSGVKDFQIEETDVGVADSVVQSSFLKMTSIVSWDLMTEDDGVKLLQVRYRDYGDNVVSSSDMPVHFRTYKEIENKRITSIFNSGEHIYTAFEGDVSSPSSDPPLLYKDQSLAYTMDGNVTDMEMYNDTLYISIKDTNENKGILQRESGSTLNNVEDNDLNSLYSADSVINSMEVFDDNLFLGLQNGKLLSFNGATILEENSVYFNTKSINLLKADGSLLYVFFENSTEFLVVYKDDSGDYVFDNVVDMGV